MAAKDKFFKIDDQMFSFIMRFSSFSSWIMQDKAICLRTHNAYLIG